MDKNRDISRNTPSDKGRGNDPHIRDESAAQPGISTVSNSQYDEDNEQVTKSGTGFGERTSFDTDRRADRAFDDADDDNANG